MESAKDKEGTMCTAIRLKNDHTYFGRNLDLDYEFGQKVVLTPRNHPFSFLAMPKMEKHFAILGMASVVNHYPLYADAMNEEGLAIAGLNFPGYAHYFPMAEGKDNLSPFELIPYLLGRFRSVEEVSSFAKNLSFLDVPFSPEIPLATLHYIVADRKSSIVLESTKAGLQVYENPFDVLTNNPPFPFHVENMRRYRLIGPKDQETAFSQKLDLKSYSVGFGTRFLPGDYSSDSRFVKAAYLVQNALFEGADREWERRLFFRILESVSFLPGCVINDNGKKERTIYSSGMDLDEMVYLYRPEKKDGLLSFSMKGHDLDGMDLLIEDLSAEEGKLDKTLEGKLA